jgi:hypothetical protein
MVQSSNFLETDHGRLPEGMKRIGYDHDTERYTYRDQDGSIWQGEPGSQYGKLSLVLKAPNEPASPITEPGSAPGSPTSGDRKEKMFAPDIKDIKRLSEASLDVHIEDGPPPPYKRPSRQFTDFDQLFGGQRPASPVESTDTAKVKPTEKSTVSPIPTTETPAAAPAETPKTEQPPTGVLSRVKRTLSISKQATASLLQRRGTL